MKKIILSLITLTCLVSCKQQKPVDNKVKIEVAVYEGWPITKEKEFEIEAIFIPIERIGIHIPGDTVLIEPSGFIRELPFRYEDNGHVFTDTTGLQKVVIHGRVLPNKFIKED